MRKLTLCTLVAMLQGLSPVARADDVRCAQVIVTELDGTVLSCGADVLVSEQRGNSLVIAPAMGGTVQCMQRAAMVYSTKPGAAVWLPASRVKRWVCER